jgi:hypothetical protein
MTPLTPIGLVLLLACAAAMLVVPRRWAPVPLLLITCYMVLSQGILLGPFNFFSIRLMILVGFARAVLRGEFADLRYSRIDALMLSWAAWALAASAFHDDPEATLVANGGLVFNTLGVYVLLRAFCRTLDDIGHLCRIAVLLLVPVSLEMVYEKVAASNAFSVLGGVPDVPNFREGRIRAQGPFAHSILGGTVGAVMLPIALGLWNSYRRTAIVGAAACATIVITSASSGPLLSAIFATMALAFWRWRHLVRPALWCALGTYMVLSVAMKAPPYYLLARIDLSGGSTGYHRARLIESSIHHLNEWWFAGTDVTRHWMATGVSWSPNHTDITNHYLVLGVQGGLPLTLLFVAVLWACFATVGRALRAVPDGYDRQAFLIWSLGASLFAHAATCISVSYFDQSFVFLYVLIAALATLATLTPRAVRGAIADASPPYAVDARGGTADLPLGSAANSPTQ